MKTIQRKPNSFQKNKIQKKNVLSIAASPRFQQPKTEFYSHTVSADIYGFLKNDKLICQANFDLSDIKPNSLVIAETENGKALKIAAEVKSEIVALVVAFQREVAK